MVSCAIGAAFFAAPYRELPIGFREFDWDAAKSSPHIPGYVGEIDVAKSVWGAKNYLVAFERAFPQVPWNLVRFWRGQAARTLEIANRRLSVSGSSECPFLRSHASLFVIDSSLERYPPGALLDVRVLFLSARLSARPPKC